MSLTHVPISSVTVSGSGPEPRVLVNRPWSALLGALRHPWYGVVALPAYALLAVVLTWPLALHLGTALPGDPSGDTGVYVWNLWIFRHELVRHGHLPFSTQHIFGFTGGADFALHNYTAIAGALAYPVVGALGVVAAFNLVLLAAIALSAGATSLLARQLGLAPLRAWITGALFVATPLLSARETAHLSLVMTGALPLFLWTLFRAVDGPSGARGIAVGATVALATYSDAYYGIYCVLMGTFVLAWRFVHIERQERAPRMRRLRRIVDGLAVVVAVGAAAGVASGRHDLQIGPLGIRGLDEPYAPALMVVLCVIARTLLTRRYRFSLVDRELILPLLRCGVIAVVTCLILLAPPLSGIAQRYVSGRIPQTAVLWRSSPRGVDALGYAVPNPVHAVAGKWTERWLLPPVEDAFPELVASCSLVATGLVLLAAGRRQLPKLWVAFTAFFVLLSLGPFVHVAGLNTFVPGPWALLRYVPVIGMARSPSRFAIVAALGLSLLFGFLLEQWMTRRTRARRALVAAVLALVALEVIPGPRPLFSAAVPDIYRFVAVDQDEQGRLLELPSGIRDGTSSVGDFSAKSAFFQTGHGRPLIGGYLSRVSERRRQDSLRSPMLRALYALSEPDSGIDAAALKAAREDAPAFLTRSCVRFVMVDTRRASPELRNFAVDALGLVLVHADEQFELLAPESPPACESGK